MADAADAGEGAAASAAAGGEDDELTKLEAQLYGTAGDDGGDDKDENESLESGPRIVIDLDFEEQMTESDIRHLVQQLGFSYSANKQVERPAHLYFTSFKGGVATAANRMISGMENWFVTRTEQSYTEVFGSPEDRQNLVYLTADSNEELEELDDNKIYIVGGLVDHNRYKGLCERQARAAGIATARLPIARHIALASRAVLTVNHVFQIMVEQLNRKDWAAVLDQVLPLRKRADYAAQQQQQQQTKGQEEHKGEPGAKKGAAKAARRAASAAAPGGTGGAPAEAAAAEEQGAAGAGAGAAGGAAGALEEAPAAEEQGSAAAVADAGAPERGVKRKAEDDADGAEGDGRAKVVAKGDEEQVQTEGAQVVDA
ncbi:tRNA (guanine(9)-N1)-methyltransferase [Tetrabaena socialis]|uniref:tRNA (guanine(9)-N(1))-methyltransferase n=1 Tax=Tetrabaena socialis TaxID=47790 RepID=A0A2J8A162_9CHLO|nr:tRNA (guanine(9)-N1)-methyltransferase [Tetrabaena socialis]|eukprot:PNH06261.1 tRNA (guanine(9)-N1)-methyltransferase [Tetrabaena socialis]